MKKDKLSSQFEAFENMRIEADQIFGGQKIIAIATNSLGVTRYVYDDGSSEHCGDDDDSDEGTIFP